MKWDIVSKVEVEPGLFKIRAAKPGLCSMEVPSKFSEADIATIDFDKAWATVLSISSKWRKS